jgi:hypothetical protein
MDRLMTFACMVLATLVWIVGLNGGPLLFFLAAALVELMVRLRLPTRRAA